MKQTIITFVFVFAFFATATLAPIAQAVDATSTATSTATTTVATTTVATTTATTTPAVNSTIAGLLAQLAKLTTLFNELKAKLIGTQAELKELRADIREGMTDADIKTIQELLASDPTIYPRGLITGYFGPMTKEAVKRFQAKNGLEVTGEIDAETRAAMDAIIEARRAEGKFPVGLLFAPGLKLKFEDKFKKRCEGVSASTTAGMICVKVKNKHKMDDDDEDDDNDNSGSAKPATLQGATRQIDDAMKAASDLKKKLAKKEYASTTSSATLATVKADLVAGEKDITDAKKALSDGDYVKAVTLADRAEETLDDAKDLLEGDKNDDDDMDEDDDEDDDDDDDDEDDDDDDNN